MSVSGFRIRIPWPHLTLFVNRNSQDVAAWKYADKWSAQGSIETKQLVSDRSSVAGGRAACWLRVLWRLRVTRDVTWRGDESCDVKLSSSLVIMPHTLAILLTVGLMDSALAASHQWTPIRSPPTTRSVREFRGSFCNIQSRHQLAPSLSHLSRQSSNSLHWSHQRDSLNVVKTITQVVDTLTCHTPLSLTTIMFLDLPIQTLSASVRKMVSFVREIVMKYLVCFEGVIFATFSLFKMLSERLNLNGWIRGTVLCRY